MDKETVITHLQIIHTWAEFARKRDLQFFTAKHLEDIAKWSDDAIELMKEQDELLHKKQCDINKLCNEISEWKHKFHDRPLNEQEAKTGHWLKKMSSCPSAIAMGGSRICVCDLCGGWGRKTFKYCPHCGAKMEEPNNTYSAKRSRHSEEIKDELVSLMNKFLENHEVFRLLELVVSAVATKEHEGR